ncbi:hypothetical protein ACH41E_29650 [Streptomyces sp. NPDC020412]|uniref:hypothetical protein n=1 Tax=Streptomyces sp. NPDC020412 TaxID=3365073 RepID=UPI0037900A7A
MSRKKVYLHFNARPNFPYGTEDSRVLMEAREEGNLDIHAAAGRVSMARHHIVPLNTIAQIWNEIIDQYYGNNTKSPPEKFVKYLESLRKSIPELCKEPSIFQPALGEEDKRQAREVLTGMMAKSIYHGGAAGDNNPFSMGLSVVFAMICWTPGNLVLGPQSGLNINWLLGQVRALRVDDPENSFEPHLPARVKGPRKQQVLNAVDAARMAADGAGDPQNFFACFQKLSASRKFYLPQDIGEKDWERIAEGEWVVPPIAENLRALPRNDYLYKEAVKTTAIRNGTGRILRQVTDRKRLDYGNIFPTVPQELPDVPPGLLPSEIIIEGVPPIKLEPLADSPYRKAGRGSVTDVPMGKFIAWAADKWSNDLDLPDFISSLELRKLSVTVETGPQGWETWQCALAVELTFAGITTEVIIYVEYLKGLKVALGAFFSLQDTSEPSVEPIYFGGELSKDGPDWQLRATGGPVGFPSLCGALGIKTDDLSPELLELVPDVVGAELVCRFRKTGADLIVEVKTGLAQLVVACLSG